MSHRRSLWRIGFAAVLSVSGLVYAGTLRAGLVWDDHVLVNGQGIADSALHCFTRPFLAHYYRPLVSLDFLAENALWRGAPLGYHVTSVLLHVLCTALVMLLARAAVRRRWAALAAGSLFAVQPVQAGVTAWVGGRTDALAVLFTCMFGIALIRAARCIQESVRRKWLVGALAAWVAALLTKEQTVAMLPLVPLAFACFAPAASRPRGAAMIRACAPFLVAAVAFFAAGWLAGMPRPHGGLADIPARLPQVGLCALYYAISLFAPSGRWLHTFSLSRLEEAGPLAPLAGFAILTAVVWLYWRARRSDPAAAWLIAFAVLPMVLVLDVLPLPFLLVSPWRAAVSGVAVAIMLGRWLSRPRPGAIRRLSPAFAAGLLLWSAAVTLSDTASYRDDLTLLATNVRLDPGCLPVRYLYANQLVTAGREREAETHLDVLLSALIGGDYCTERASERILNERGLRERIRLAQGSRDNPAIWMTTVYSQLGYCRLHTGDVAGARAAFLTATPLAPESPILATGLGICELSDGRFDDSERWLRRALEAEPAKADAHVALGYALQGQKRLVEAKAEFDRWGRQ